MCGSSEPCEISVVIPVYNEVDSIGDILSCLAAQRDVVPEIVICDGGSTDGTVERIRGTDFTVPFPVRVIESEKGRGRQMNAGARAARGTYLLFLHADSVFRDCRALRKALDALRNSSGEAGCLPVAGRFALTFDRHDTSQSFFYYWLECKARLDREGCIHGDQGFLMERRSFFEAGMFSETCSMMEDTNFAETVRARGLWTLFPAEILTSARRFQTEGEVARQLLNGILMTLTAVGREDFIGRLRGVYACQRDAGPLKLSSFLTRIDRMLAALPWSGRRAFWRDTGKYVCENAWQAAFCMDVRRSFRKGIPPGQARHTWMNHVDRRWRRFLSSGPMTRAAAVLSWIFFHVLRVTLRLLSPGYPPRE